MHCRLLPKSSVDFYLVPSLKMGIELVMCGLKNIGGMLRLKCLLEPQSKRGANPRRASQVCVECQLLELTGSGVKLRLSLGLWPESVMGEERGTRVCMSWGIGLRFLDAALIEVLFTDTCPLFLFRSSRTESSKGS